jgi:GntR family transcriptional regulator
MFQFRLSGRSAVPTYAQLVQQVRHAVQTHRLERGDQLPTVKDAAEHLLVSPNTILKAYRQLELEGIVRSRHGIGTFVASAGQPQPAGYVELERRLEVWLLDAQRAGLDEEALDALWAVTRQDALTEGAA